MGDSYSRYFEAYRNALILGASADDRIAKHLEIVTGLNELYARKNHDYGNSFAQQRLRREDSSLYDKYLRIEQLMESEAKVADESIEDTLLDLANYAIMEVVERYIERVAEQQAHKMVESIMAPVNKSTVAVNAVQGGDGV
jgi:hypothetical protein